MPCGETCGEVPSERRLKVVAYAAQAYSECMSITKDERLAVRVTARQKQTIERAAAVLGRNVTEFSIQALTERAEEVLTDRHAFGITQEAWDEFIARLDAPAQPVAELVALMRRPSVFDE